MSKWQDSEVTVHAPVVLLWVTVKCIMIISLSSLCFSALYIFEICTHFLQTVLMYCAIKDVRLLTHTIYVHCIELQPQAATGDNFIHPTRWNWFERLVNWKTQEGKKKKRRISFSCTVIAFSNFTPGRFDSCWSRGRKHLALSLRRITILNFPGPYHISENLPWWLRICLAMRVPLCLHGGLADWQTGGLVLRAAQTNAAPAGHALVTVSICGD